MAKKSKSKRTSTQSTAAQPLTAQAPAPPPALAPSRAAALSVTGDGPTGNILINLFDGARQPLADTVQWSAVIRDGRSPSESQTFNVDGNGPSDLVKGLPFFGTLFFNNYTVLINSKGFDDAAWMPVTIAQSQTTSVFLMLLEEGASFNFSGATWDQLNSRRPRFAEIFQTGISDASDQYAAAIEDNGGFALGCWLNLLTAMSQIILPSTKTPLDYFWQIVRDDPNFPMAQDRFFAYVDKAIVDDVIAAGNAGSFSKEPDPSIFHKGATLSYKQNQFDTANVQLTFHQGNTKTLTAADGSQIECIIIEPDIDYFKDLTAHFLLEVLPNAFKQQLTDPRVVCMLRWIAGKQANTDFDPLYTLTA